MRVLTLIVAAAAAFVVNLAQADVRLPKLVGDGMVLQRDARVVLWGWANPSERVKIAFNGVRVSTTANSRGGWSTTIGPFPAGGPYDMTVKGKNSLELHDILIGDVWLASGQSNMEFPLKPSGNWKTSVNNAEREIAGANFPMMRLYRVHQKIGFHPVNDAEADVWTAVTPQSVGDFSAVAYLFGRELHQRYCVPIGLIETSWGGTPAEAWMSEAGLKTFPEFDESIRHVNRANEKTTVADRDAYVKQKTLWDSKHGTEDRGQLNGRAVWADPTLDVTGWQKVVEPQSKPVAALKGFDGPVWFRREVTIPAEQAGKDLQVHLVTVGKTDVTYFNGERIGSTEGWDEPRDYFVPGKWVKSGRNVITVRITGEGGYIGMFDSNNPDKLNVEVGGITIPLAGTWYYQSGPDLADLPPSPALWSLVDNPNTPTVLFNGMINPLAPFRIRGVIWYQGEANADRPVQYRTLFPALIKDWRKHWGYEVPFLFVQLAGFGHNKAEPAEYPWAELREAQSMTLALPATGMATAIDIGDEDDIHPRNKQDVAHRLALAAAKVVYGENVVSSGPTFASIQIEGDCARIKFGNLGSGLQIRDKYGYARGFEIAGADGRFLWARAQQDGQDVVVSNQAVRQPMAVRYDWSNTPDGNVLNKDGLPAIPFRTDAPTR
jgi:sialate O-acetylesterase